MLNFICIFYFRGGYEINLKLRILLYYVLLDKTGLDPYFSNFNMHMNHLVNCLKCRF